jgi:hypothetical protein
VEGDTNYWALADRKEAFYRTMFYVLVFLSSVIFVDLQIAPFRPSSHPATESQSFRYSVKTFSRFAIARGPENTFSLEPEPAIGDPPHLMQYF